MFEAANWNKSLLYVEDTSFSVAMESVHKKASCFLSSELQFLSYVTDDRIKAHFLTCYISLLVYRLLEKKLGEGFTCSQILETLRGMNMTLLSKNSGYIPSYKRTLLTDALHDVFGFRTDYEFISKSSMRNIIKETKSKKSTKAKI